MPDEKIASLFAKADELLGSKAICCPRCGGSVVEQVKINGDQLLEEWQCHSCGGRFWL